MNFKKQRTHEHSVFVLAFPARSPRIRHRSELTEVIGGSLEERDGKAFCNYIKLNRTDSIGTHPLKVENNVIDSDKDKANISNTVNTFSRFSQMKTPQISQRKACRTSLKSGTSCLPQLELRNNYETWSQIKQQDLTGYRHGYWRTLRTNALKSLKIVFTQFYDSGNAPEEWQTATVSSIHKKDDKSLPNNYRPISLTCIACKVMEHVLSSHTSRYFEVSNILTPHQHGFRKGFSTETQLISVLRYHHFSKFAIFRRLNRAHQDLSF